MAARPNELAICLVPPRRHREAITTTIQENPDSVCPKGGGGKHLSAHVLRRLGNAPAQVKWREYSQPKAEPDARQQQTVQPGEVE